MKKLYLATKTVNCIFVSSADLTEDLKEDAEKFMRNEMAQNIDRIIDTKRITSLEEIPKEWKDAFIWGCEEELTPGEALKQFSEKSDEYKEYLRLKAKFT